jgi:hypothetical protein
MPADIASPSASHKEIRGLKDSEEVVDIEMDKRTVKMTKPFLASPSTISVCALAYGVLVGLLAFEG